MSSGCVAYRPGHHVHWIQARLARQEPGEHFEAVGVEPGDGGGWLTVSTKGGVRRFWGHDPDDLARVVGRRVVFAQGMLQTLEPDQRSGDYPCVSVADEPSACSG